MMKALTHSRWLSGRTPDGYRDALTLIRNCASLLLSLLCVGRALSSHSHEIPEKIYCNIAGTLNAGICVFHIAGYTASELIMYEQRFPP